FCSHSSRLPPPSPPPPTRRSSDLLAPAALKDDRLRLRPRHEVDVRPREELRPEAEPLGRIVVAADRNDRHAELPGHPPEKIRERSEEHTSELQSLTNLVCRLLLEK